MVPVFLIIRLTKRVLAHITGEEDKLITKAVTMVGAHVVEQGKNLTGLNASCAMASPTVSSKAMDACHPSPRAPQQQAVAAAAA